MAGEPTLARFAFALVMATCILVAHIEHRGLLDMLARIGIDDTPNPAPLSEPPDGVVLAGTLGSPWGRSSGVPEYVQNWVVTDVLIWVGIDLPARSLADAPLDVREWFDAHPHDLVRFFGWQRAIVMHDQLFTGKSRGPLNSVKTAAASLVRNARAGCDPLDVGPWRSEPALDVTQMHTIRRPWLLIAYALHWHWAWNALCLVAINMDNMPIERVNMCMVKHVDAVLLIACYAYMARVVWIWRRPPAKKED